MSQNAIQEFKFQNLPVRTSEIEGQIWWVLQDICNALDLSNSRVAADQLDDDERRKFYLPRQGETWFANESGLYALILRSNKPNAKPFRKWVTSVVLPSIRKTGSYSLTETGGDIIKNRYISLLEKHNDLLIDLALYKDQARNAKKIRPMTEFEIAQIRGMTADGFGCAAIARELDRAESTIRRHRQEVSHE